jgi:hypothetical protein
MKMIEEVTITLDNGYTITSIGDHMWTDTGMPGLSRCDCGVYRKYDRQKSDYTYSESEGL